MLDLSIMNKFISFAFTVTCLTNNIILCHDISDLSSGDLDINAEGDKTNRPLINSFIISTTTDNIKVRSTTPDNTTDQNADNDEDQSRNSIETSEEHEEQNEQKEEEYDDRGYSYTVSIQKRGSHYATGALVAKRWILTTAREFYHIRELLRLFRVRLGSIDCKNGGLLIPIMKIEIHPKYTLNSPNYDIALIKMGIPVNATDDIKAIPLSKVPGDVVSGRFTSTYWARLIVNGTVLPENAKERLKPNSLRLSKQTVVPWDDCFMDLKEDHVKLSNSSLCLKSIHDHHSPCMPDSGAPVVYGNSLWGITSGWTPENCTKSGHRNQPTIVTRVSSLDVTSWMINKVLNS